MTINLPSFFITAINTDTIPNCFFEDLLVNKHSQGVDIYFNLLTTALITNIKKEIFKNSIFIFQ